MHRQPQAPLAEGGQRDHLIGSRCRKVAIVRDTSLISLGNGDKPLNMQGRDAIRGHLQHCPLRHEEPSR
jgi:hypothetical protein